MNQAITEKNLAPYKKDISIIVEKSEALTIKTVEEIETASDILNKIGLTEDKIKAEKEKLTKPAQEIITWARGIFSPLEGECKKAEKIIKGKMLEFNNKQEAKKNKKLEKISRKVADGDMEASEAAEKIKDLDVQKSYSGEEGSIQFRNQKTIVITNLDKVPRKYLKPNDSLIKKEMLSGGKIPGIEIRIEKIVAKRSL